MKKIIITFLLGMILLSSHAQAPQAFQYQAIARDIEGNVLANQDVSFKIVILKESINGTAVYRETHDTITNALGLVTLAIGNGTVITGVFENINWGDGLYFLKILMDENGGANYQLMGITQLLSVPYSLYSASSGDAGATQINDLTDAKTAGNNVYLGLGAGVDDDSTNNQNVGVGRIALNANTSGYYNTAIGNYSLFTNTVGHHNTSAGHNSLYNNTAGNNNTALGNAANLFNEEGSNNTIIGFQAGRGTSAHNKFGNVFLGYRAGYNDTTDNKLYIENSGSSTPLIWGDFEDNILAFNANVGIGTNNPYAKLDVRGNSPDDGAIIRTGNSDGSHRLSFFPGRENDPNPFIQWKEGDPFRFSTDEGGWSEKMRISGNGNIGIGTTDPSEMLEVAGSIYSSAGGFKFPDGTVQATAAAGGATGNTLDQAYDQGGWGAGRTIIADNGAVNIQGSGGLTVNGNIGIGTIAPAYPLSIQPGTSTMGLYIDHNQTDAGNTHGLLIDLAAIQQQK